MTGCGGPSGFTLILFSPMNPLILPSGWPPTAHVEPVFLSSGKLGK